MSDVQKFDFVIIKLMTVSGFPFGIIYVIHEKIKMVHYARDDTAISMELL